MSRRKWLLAVLAVLMVVVILSALGTLVPPVSDAPPRAVFQAKAIVEACEAYRDNPTNPERGKYPSTLIELVNPPFGGPPFLRNGEADLFDPWGKQFEYAVKTDTEGNTEVSVWTERIVDGKLKLLGAKRTTTGKIELFGLPDE
ncbi:MAG: hypothetical protein L0241_01125 [Planctomycetia bacterium]|nr:hypothetical protein [Planctomycetia bacterium]